MKDVDMFVGLNSVLPKFRTASVVILRGGKKRGGSGTKKKRYKDIRRSSRWIRLYMEV